MFEVLIFSICNCFEIYIFVWNLDFGVLVVSDFFSSYFGFEIGELIFYLFSYYYEDVVDYLMCVVLGFDSFVLGEG